MGLGPAGTQPGDVICVFLGGAVPWVIREDGDDDVLVGECYVHGIMDGEIIRTKAIPVQDIILK